MNLSNERVEENERERELVGPDRMHGPTPQQTGICGSETDSEHRFIDVEYWQSSSLSPCLSLTLWRLVGHHTTSRSFQSSNSFEGQCYVCSNELSTRVIDCERPKILGRLEEIYRGDVQSGNGDNTGGN